MDDSHVSILGLADKNEILGVIIFICHHIAGNLKSSKEWLSDDYLLSFDPLLL